MLRRCCEALHWTDALPFLSWVALLALFLLHVVTHGAGVSSMLTLVFFAALALNA